MPTKLIKLSLSEDEIVTAMDALADKVKIIDQSKETSNSVIVERQKAEGLRAKLSRM